MLLEAGQILGSYEVLGPLGAGGMGEVYRARDTRLDREIAIKVLPADMAEDDDRRRRFEREAKTLASLNHPNVAAIHGIEQHGDLHYLVLELVPGEDLATRLARGALPVDEAIAVCRQIAEGVEAAHEAGVVHRDLKPANVRLTPHGIVKVLDFGLAKPMHVDARSDATSTASSDSFLLTEEGLILGTMTYMSPEQARGRPVDRRTDIWAFGCVLYECLTGERAFAGATFSDVLAAIVRGEANTSALPRSTPSAVRALLERCLQKDANLRLRDIGEARILLASDDLDGPADARVPKRFNPAVALMLGVILALVAALLVTALDEPTPVDRGPLHFAVDGPTGVTGLEDPVLSRDGRRLVFSAVDAGTVKLYLRDLDQIDAKEIPGTAGAHSPCLSPDGAWVAFFADGKLKKTALSGGDPLTLCETQQGAGATWLTNDSILLSMSWLGGFSRVPASGGKPEVITEIDQAAGEQGHWWPDALGDGRFVLFTVFREGTGINDARIAILDVEARTWKTLLRGARAQFAEPDRLLYYSAGAYYSAAFDPARQRLLGEARALPFDIPNLDPNGTVSHYVTIGGIDRLAFVPRQGKAGFSTPVWVSRAGKIEAELCEPGPFVSVSLSPDDRRLATSEVAQGVYTIDVHDLERGTRDRLPLAGSCSRPIWHSDGKRIFYMGMRKGDFDAFIAHADGTNEETLLDGSADEEITARFGSEDSILVSIGEASGSVKTVVVEAKTRTRRDLVAVPPEATDISVSPDGKHLAYVRQIDGRDEVYVQRSDGSGSRLRVSTKGGTQPLFSPVTNELFFLRDHTIVAVGFDVKDDALTARREVDLFTDDSLVRGSDNWGIARDGKRFLMMKRVANAKANIEVVVGDTPK